MKENPLDKLFREAIQQDDSELNQEELKAKKRIWNTLTMPKQSQNPFWKVAALILFLLWSFSFTFLQRKAILQKAQSLQLERKLRYKNDSLENTILDLQASVAELSKALGQKSASTIIQEPKSVVKYETQFIDRIIEQKDTVWIKTLEQSKPDTIVIRDTVWLKKPLVIAEANRKQAAKRPSKVAFLFDNKQPKPKTKAGLPVLINERAIAGKTTGKNSGVIKVTIKK